MDGKVIAPTLPTHGYSTVFFYPTISPHIVVIPIVSCIIGFPIFILLVICALRNRARKARLKAKRRRPAIEHTITELVPHTVFNQSRYFNQRVIRMKNGKRKTIVRFKPMPELDLDTVVEEKSEFDNEVNAAELLNSIREERPMIIENHKASFRSYRYGYGASGQPLTSSNNSCYSKPNIVTETNVPQLIEKTNPLIKNTEISITIQSEDDHATLSDDTPISLKSDSKPSLKESSSTTLCSRETDFKYHCSTTSLGLLKSPVKCHIKDLGVIKCVPQIVNITDSNLKCDFQATTHKRQWSCKKLSRSCEEFQQRPVTRVTHRLPSSTQLPKEFTILHKFHKHNIGSSDYICNRRFSDKENIDTKNFDGNLVRSIIQKYENLNPTNRRLHSSKRFSID